MTDIHRKGADAMKKNPMGRGLLKAFLREEEGQGMVEYGLIIGVIVMVVVVALALTANAITDMYVNDINEDALKALHGTSSAG